MSNSEEMPDHLDRKPSLFRVSMEERRASIERIRRGAREQAATPLMESQSPIDYLAFDDEPRVYCVHDLVRMTPSANCALLLSQIVYWFLDATNHPTDGRQLPRARVCWDGKRWVNKSVKSLAVETGMSKSKVKRALDTLREENYLETQARLYEGKRTNLIRMSSVFYARLLETPLKDSGTLVYGTTVRMTKRVETALVLSQLCYWSSTNKQGRCRMRVRRNGFHWIAKTIDKLAEETGLQSRQVRTSLDNLAELGIVVKDHFIFNGRRMLHLRIEADLFSDLWMREKMVEYGG